EIRDSNVLPMARVSAPSRCLFSGAGACSRALAQAGHAGILRTQRRDVRPLPKARASLGEVTICRQ
ncbi:MAG: hypothetical protein KDB22_20485, partial [Planctomycetales bacterium]|nr:hypothetical protein [Planctomycetales bacterium]